MDKAKSSNPTPLVRLNNWTGEYEWSKYRELHIFHVVVKLERIVYGYKEEPCNLLNWSRDANMAKKLQ